MKFVVIGTSDFTISNAKGIIDSGHELNLIVSLPHQLLPNNSADISSFCVNNDVPFIEVEDINSDYLGDVDELATDVVDLIANRAKEPKKYSDSYYK